MPFNQVVGKSSLYYSDVVFSLAIATVSDNKLSQTERDNTTIKPRPYPMYDLMMQAASAVDASSVEDNPLFISSTNYHLQYGSPATNAGIYVGLTNDYDGVAVGNPPEIGAYEYV